METLTDTSGAIDSRMFRKAMTRVPTSVVVAAGMGEEGPVGMVVGTFSSVSVDPPLVGFFGDHRSATFPILMECERITFSILNQGDLDTAKSFSRPIDERFTGLDWRRTATGGVELTSAILTVETTPHSLTPAGDHVMYLGLVTSATPSYPAGRPLIFQAGRLTRLDAGQLLDHEAWQLGWVE